mmetsp:Transcript_21858/g.44502  ORF Transcript_21858/g.44502 Transcript_21858/m.44502 type:complete len:343 (-) Transcript_21858:202-1230(-)
MFYTASDLIQRMNSAITNGHVDDNESSGYNNSGFELQRKLPDGSYRPADKSEIAAVDFQAKLKQAAQITADLNADQKTEWAEFQRKEGNNLFEKGNFREAMDVYLTCLVALEPQVSKSKSIGGTANYDDPKNSNHDFPVEEEILLPVLLNLALCAMKLGMLSKAEKFCNHAIALERGKISVKAYYRRGKIRMKIGNYCSAEKDLRHALELTNNYGFVASSVSKVESERAAIIREEKKLSILRQEAKKNVKRQKDSMRAALSGDTLYPEKKGLLEQRRNNSNTTVEEDFDVTCFEWYIRMISRGASKLLEFLGDDDDGYDVGHSCRRNKAICCDGGTNSKKNS